MSTAIEMVARTPRATVLQKWNLEKLERSLDEAWAECIAHGATNVEELVAMVHRNPQEDRADTLRNRRRVLQGPRIESVEVLFEHESSPPRDQDRVHVLKYTILRSDTEIYQQVCIDAH